MSERVCPECKHYKCKCDETKPKTEMTTRKDLQAKCEELANKFADSEAAYYEYSRDSFGAGFTAALDLTWPMIEEIRKESAAAYDKGADFHGRYCKDHLAVNQLKAEVERLTKQVYSKIESILRLQNIIKDLKAGDNE